MTGKRILFVDDDDDYLSMLKAAFGDMMEDWDFVFVNRGRDALKALSLTPFDAVVTDFHMPEIDGFELLNRIMNTFPDVKRVFLTGSIDEADSLKRFGYLAHECLHKRNSLSEIKSAILRICSGDDEE